MPDIDDLFKFYREECVPAYSDLVGYIADKPVQFLTEIENAFAHVAQFHNPETTPEEKATNISKAKDHLMRVTLDSYKMLWTKMESDISQIHEDDFKRKYCINMSQGEFLVKYQNFKKTAQTARNLETQSIGIDPLKALGSYKEAIEIGRELIDAIDPEKVENSKSDLRVISLKRNVLELAISFVAGILSSVAIIKLL
jgi:hypothetical protein